MKNPFNSLLQLLRPKHAPRQDALDFIKKYDTYVIQHKITRDLETGDVNTYILLELRIPHKEEKQE